MACSKKIFLLFLAYYIAKTQMIYSSNIGIKSYNSMVFQTINLHKKYKKNFSKNFKFFIDIT